MKIRTAVILISIALLGACSSPRTPAPIVDRMPAPPSAQTPRPVVVAPKAPVNDRAYYTVKKSDTLYRIALEHGQNYNDLVVWNNLSSPNDIKIDQVLRVLPPDAGAAPSGVQTGSVVAGAVTTSSVSSGSITTGGSSEIRPSVTAVPGVVSNKTGPRADKRPYSDAALAELQKPDTASLAVAPVAAVAATAPKAIETRPPEKPVDSGSVAVAPANDDDNVGWIWPAEGKVLAGFDDNKKGIDIAGQIGQQVVAAGAGRVMYAGSGIRGYGNLVIVKHTANLLSAYAHNKTILVKEGQNVNRGQKIAEMGNSDADAVKLHFEIRQQGKPVDPSKFLPSR